jgi:hypothetical protein
MAQHLNGARAAHGSAGSTPAPLRQAPPRAQSLSPSGLPATPTVANPYRRRS